jgi:hypothetical protein
MARRLQAGILISEFPIRMRISEGGVCMLQMLLSEWIVRIFLLYLFVVGGVALIRRQQKAVSPPFVIFPIADIRDRWAVRGALSAASRAMWWDKYPKRDKDGIRIGRKESSDGTYRRNGDGLTYA